MAVLCCVSSNANSHSPPLFRIGFSKTTFGEVNENDAIAAVRVWAQAVARERDILADPQPTIFWNVNEIILALTNKSIDCICLTTDEYAMIPSQMTGDTIVAGVVSGSITEEFVLLVHRKSGIDRLKDLEGHTLGLLESWRTKLAPTWLDTLLAQNGFGLASDFFGKITALTKTGKTVLPVFFRQTDACVVTRKGFETMIELNPQTGQQLKIVAASPPVVPVVFCFRSNYSSPLRKKIMDEITRWHLFPAGQQILTIFQTDMLEEQPISCLNSAFEILASHKRLLDKTNSAPGDKGKVSGESYVGGN
jgi:phosphonate transport system substrate-binding protein